jgi:hypothetical protein
MASEMELEWRRSPGQVISSKNLSYLSYFLCYILIMGSHGEGRNWEGSTGTAWRIMAARGVECDIAEKEWDNEVSRCRCCALPTAEEDIARWRAKLFKGLVQIIRWDALGLALNFTKIESCFFQTILLSRRVSPGGVLALEHQRIHMYFPTLITSQISIPQWENVKQWYSLVFEVGGSEIFHRKSFWSYHSTLSWWYLIIILWSQTHSAF